MSTPIHLALVISALASVAVLVAGRRGAARLSPGKSALCAAPSLVSIGLFYSLAIHLRSSLGAWPRALGEDGFPTGLVVHAELAMRWFSALLLATLLAWPVGFLLCLLVRAWWRGAVYLGVHALSFAVCVGLMRLAPEPFLYWWWD